MLPFRLHARRCPMLCPMLLSTRSPRLRGVAAGAGAARAFVRPRATGAGRRFERGCAGTGHDGTAAAPPESEAWRTAGIASFFVVGHGGVPPFPPSLAGGAVTTGASPPAGSREEPSQGGGARDPRHQGRAQPSGKGCPGSPLNREVTVEWSLCGRRRGAPFICGPGLSLVWYSQPVFRRFSDEVPMRLN